MLNKDFVVFLIKVVISLPLIFFQATCSPICILETLYEISLYPAKILKEIALNLGINLGIICIFIMSHNHISENSISLHLSYLIIKKIPLSSCVLFVNP